MKKDRIKELETKINQARNDYYNAQSKISDKVYDAMIDELFELDPKNPAVIGIGCEPVSNWEKYQHKYPLGSLNKCQTHEEFMHWANNYVSKGDQFFLTLKLDGLSVSLVYENGVLVIGASRGSGKIGEKITTNVARMIGVPLRLNQKINATIRGEILLSKENHQKYFADYSNTRNAASGIARRYDGEGSDKLTVLCYNLITDNLKITTQEQQFEELQSLGLITPRYYICKTANDIEQVKEQYVHSLRAEYAFDLDGLVVSNNDLIKGASFGQTNNKPKSSIAMKFDSLAKEATISDIQIQCGRSGRLTPVAIFSPKVHLMGADIERASLHNFSNIASLGVDIGAKVLVCRSNDVIPFIEEVVEDTGTVFQPPTHCPECGSEAVENGEYYQCPNIANCPSMRCGRIKNWIKEIGILEFGDVLIEKLVESELVNDIADLYTLTVEELASLERMGDRSAQKCYDNLWAANQVSLEVLLGGLSIPMIGQSTIKAIMSAGYSTLEQFMKLTAADFEKVSGVGPTKAKSLEQGLQNNKELIMKMIESGVEIKEPNTNGKLAGKSFCFTGALSIKRAEAEKKVMELGGEIKAAISANTSFLVIADPNSASSKAQKARKLGTQLIDENTFLSMIQ